MIEQRVYVPIKQAVQLIHGIREARNFLRGQASVSDTTQYGTSARGAQIKGYITVSIHCIENYVYTQRYVHLIIFTNKA